MINKSIEVICSFDEKGVIVPIKFRLMEDEFITCAVIGHRVEENRKDLMRFRCKVQINDTEKIAELWFYKAETRWMLYSLK